jgi:hypothetical protein
MPVEKVLRLLKIDQYCVRPAARPGHPILRGQTPVAMWMDTRLAAAKLASFSGTGIAGWTRDGDYGF